MRPIALLAAACVFALAAALAAPGVAQAQEPIDDWSTDTKQTDDFPFTEGTSLVHLVDVRAASHDSGDDHPAFDRIVLEFEGDGPPGWRVSYIDPPPREDGSGREVDVDGRAFLELRLEPATGVDLRGEEPRRTYDGPTEIGIDGNVALELVQTGDFEASLAWVIGVSHEAPFAATFLSDPLRLVVDVVDERDFDVERYQSDLNLWFRFDTDDERGPLEVDGEYGADTRDATSTFQESEGLPVTGEADSATRTALREALDRRVTPFAQRQLEWPLRVEPWFWEWARWYLGHAEFAGEQRNPDLRPADAPARIPDWGWRRLGPYLDRDEEARAELMVRQRIQAIFGEPVEELSVTLRSERDPYWILITGSHAGPEGSFAAWLKMREGRWSPWQISRLQDTEPNLRPTGAPCDIKPAFAEPEC